MEKRISCVPVSLELFEIVNCHRLQEHTEDLQDKAMNSLFNLVCSLYKVELTSIKSESFVACVLLFCLLM